VPSEEVLQAAAVRLVKAMARYRLNPSVSAADRVISARLAVKEAFIEAGWNPPPATLQAMERDRLLLREHAGGFEELPGAGEPGPVERRSTLHGPAAITARLGFACSGPRLVAG
jgi:hypothetical protein